MSAITCSSPGAIFTYGLTFQPCPRPSLACDATPSTSMPPRPRSPLGFSGLIERVSASASRHTFANPTPNPFHPVVIVPTSMS